MWRIALHEALAVHIAQDGALATAAFCQQHARASDTGGVELPKFHVFQGNACTCCHPQTVTGVDKGIGRGCKNASRTAGSQQGGLGLQNVHIPGFHFQRCHPNHRAFSITHQIHSQPFHEKAGASLQILLVQRVQHSVAGPVGCCAGALHRFFAVVSGMAAERPLVNRAIRIAVKRHAHVLQVIDHFWCFAAHELNRILVAQPVRAFDGIVKVVMPVVLVHIAQGGANATLRRYRMRAGGKYFG